MALKSNLIAASLMDLAAPSNGASKNLNFHMQSQLQTNWCWAAVATSVSIFFNSPSGWTQCDLANAQLGQTTCCHDGSTAPCNQAWYLDRALTQTNNLQNWAAGNIPFATVQQENDALKPIGVRIGWSGGGGHFLVIAGYNSTGGQFLLIEDPIYGSSTYAYTVFLTAYQASGTWTDTYFTKP